MKYLILLISVIGPINIFAITDTIYVSDKNSTYVEFSGSVIICDIAIYDGEEKRVSKDPTNGNITLKTSSYLVKAGSGVAIVKALSDSVRSTKLFIRTVSDSYELTLVYSDIEGDINYYNLNNTLPDIINNTSSNSHTDEYADIQNLPERVDIERKRDLLKYDSDEVKNRLRTLLEARNDYKDVGGYIGGISGTVTGLQVDNTHFYIKVNLNNTTPVDYRLESTTFQYIQVSKDRVLSKKRKYENSLNNVIKIDKDVVGGNVQESFGYAIPIFAIDERSYILITLKEFQGDRDLQIKMFSKDLESSYKL